MDNLELWHFPEPERQEFKQAVAIGTRSAGKLNPAMMTISEDIPIDAPRHRVPESAPDLQIWRTSRIIPEEIAAASLKCSLWEQVRPNPRENQQAKRTPPLPLHAGTFELSCSPRDAWTVSLRTAQTFTWYGGKQRRAIVTPRKRVFQRTVRALPKQRGSGINTPFR